MSKKRRLGKGLSALIGDVESEGVQFTVESPSPSAVPADGVQTKVAVSDIIPNRYQPRRRFDPDAIRDLAASIRSQGLIQPIVLNDRGDGSYELISGERRLRAIRTLEWHTVPAVVRKVDDAGLLEMTLVENLQREDLDPIEEAEAYGKLGEVFGLTQAQIAERVGRERSTVANSLRLLKLPEVIRREIASGILTAGHARQLLVLERESEQLEMARRVIAGDISVRRLEKMIRELKNNAGKKPAGDHVPSAAELTNIRELEDKLRQALSTKVKISSKGDGKGRIEIEYYSYEEFERLMELLDVPPLG